MDKIVICVSVIVIGICIVYNFSSNNKIKVSNKVDIDEYYIENMSEYYEKLQE